MASFIISGSRGTDDPTMATLPFMAAKTAKEQGHDVVLWLWNEAVTLGRKGTADHVSGVNLTPARSRGRSADPIWWRAPPSRACRITSRP
jgi:predicted peroxiredoxin